VLLLAPIYFACRAELLLASVVRRRKRRGKKRHFHRYMRKTKGSQGA